MTTTPPEQHQIKGWTVTIPHNAKHTLAAKAARMTARHQMGAPQGATKDALGRRMYQDGSVLETRPLLRSAVVLPPNDIEMEGRETKAFQAGEAARRSRKPIPDAYRKGSKSALFAEIKAFRAGWWSVPEWPKRGARR